MPETLGTERTAAYHVDTRRRHLFLVSHVSQEYVVADDDDEERIKEQKRSVRTFTELSKPPIRTGTRAFFFVDCTAVQALELALCTEQQAAHAAFNMTLQDFYCFAI